MPTPNILFNFIIRSKLEKNISSIHNFSWEVYCYCTIKEHSCRLLKIFNYAVGILVKLSRFVLPKIINYLRTINRGVRIYQKSSTNYEPLTEEYGYCQFRHLDLFNTNRKNLSTSNPYLTTICLKSFNFVQNNFFEVVVVLQSFL